MLIDGVVCSLQLHQRVTSAACNQPVCALRRSPPSLELSVLLLERDGEILFRSCGAVVALWGFFSLYLDTLTL